MNNKNMDKCSSTNLLIVSTLPFTEVQPHPNSQEIQAMQKMLHIEYSYICP